MRKYYIILILLFSFLSMFSQTKKGNHFIGGQFNISGNTVSNLDATASYEYKYVGFTLTPNYGYFIKDNFVLGVNINFVFTSTSQDNAYDYPTPQLPSQFSNKSKTFNYGLGIFARHYKDLTDNLKLFINGGVNYAYQIQKITDTNNDPNYIYPSSSPELQKKHGNNISVAITPGLVYFATSKLGIQASYGNIYYNYSNLKNTDISYDNHNNSSSFGLNLNLNSFLIGLNYYF